MKEDFAKDLARVLKHEGGKVDHPKDPGGRTNKGITQRVYTAWLRDQKLPLADVYNIRPEHVTAIYKTRYWDLVWGDRLPTGVAFAVFDAAVNSGPARGVLWLQLALGNVRADGAMGPATLKAVEEDLDHDALIQRMVDLRRRFVRALSTYKTFGKGWERRYSQVLAVAQAEATGLQAPPVQFVALGNGKANLEDARRAPPVQQATAIATGAGSGGAASTGLDKAEAFTWVPGVSKLIGIATVLLFVVAAAAGLYLLWAHRKRRELDEALNVRRPQVTPANDNGLVDDGEDEDAAMAVHLAGTLQRDAA